MNDEDWHEKVEEHLLRDLIEDLQERVKELDITLRGERGHTGLIAEYRRHDDILTKLYAVIIQDSTGKKGLLHDVDYLIGRRSNREKSVQYKWQFWTAITVAVISAATMLATNWEKVKKMLPTDHPGPLEQRIERAKRPKSKKKIYQYRVIPSPSEPAPEKAPSPNP